tara:strand:+ start:3747 stop:4454 length:708 start_codon:yes stop_codon:yes gene_type:complete
MDYPTDTFIPWSNKSKDVPFKEQEKCVGNGERKLAKELNISTGVGGQNSIADLVHPKVGPISVKDMTNDNCTLGVDGSNEMRKIFRKVLNPFVSWCEKYQSKCKIAKYFYDSINKSYGQARTTILDGIDRCEIAQSNLTKLNIILKELNNHFTLNKKNLLETKYNSLDSEYIKDISINLGEKCLQDLLNECSQKEATDMTLIIVHEKKGWLIVKDISKISCPRITRGSPRIHYTL